MNSWRGAFTRPAAVDAFARRAVFVLCAILVACQPQRSAVHLNVARAAATPRDASVYIDEEFVGLLGVVAARGVRLPGGDHRISVEKVGYFPWDRLVVSDRQPLYLTVELRKIPD